jgi:hypothetical protein
MERKPLPKYWNSRDLENPVGNLCGKDLQQENYPIHQITGNGNHEKKEKEGEESATGGIKAVKKDKSSDPTEDRREDHHREEVVLIELRTKSFSNKVKCNPGNNQSGTGKNRVSILLEYLPPPNVDEVYRYMLTSGIRIIWEYNSLSREDSTSNFIGA